MDQIQPLTLNELEPFPLPKYLDSLPVTIIEQFVEQHNLILGYIKQLPAYQKTNDTVIEALNWQITKLNEISSILETYTITGLRIKDQIAKLNSIYSEFINMETYQYQLLSSNFNPEFLKNKFHKVIMDNDRESKELVKKLKQGSSGVFVNSFDNFIKDFRSNRKAYHLRKEKLNRWNEERVSGFIWWCVFLSNPTQLEDPLNPGNSISINLKIPQCSQSVANKYAYSVNVTVYGY